MTSIAPGWYKDPADPSTQRYWDGEGWLGAPIPADATPPPGPPRASPPEPLTNLNAYAAPPPPPPPTMPPPTMPPPSMPPPPVRPPPPAPAPAVHIPTGPPRPMPPGVGIPPGSAPPGRPYLPYVFGPPPRPHGLALASPAARLVARLIDIGAVLVLNVVVNGWFVWQYAQEIAPTVREVARRLQTPNPNTEGIAQESPRASYLLMVIIILATALWFAYEVPAVANTGQTLGKRLLGVKVVGLEHPGQLGFGRSMRRWNTLGLPTLFWTCFGIGFIMQFVDCLYAAVDRPLHQALHDKSARTVVVVVDRHAPAGTSAPDETNASGGTS